MTRPGVRTSRLPPCARTRWLAMFVFMAAVGVTACDKPAADTPSPANGDVPSEQVATTEGADAVTVDEANKSGKDAASSALADGTVSAAAPVKATVFSLRRRAMKQRWSLASILGSAPTGDLVALDSGTLLVPTGAGLHIIAAEDGKHLGTVPVTGRIVDGPHRFGNDVWVLEGTTAPSTKDAPTAGRKKRRARPTSRLAAYNPDKLSAGPHTELLVAGDMRRIVGFTPTAVVLIGKAPARRTGSQTRYELLAFKRRPNAKRATPPVWRKTPRVASGWQWLVRMHGPRLIIPDARRVVALDVSTGVARWMWRTSGEARPGVFGALVDGHYELVDGGKLIRLDMSTGKLTPNSGLSIIPTSDFVADGTQRYFGTKDATVAVDIRTGKTVWSVPVPSSGKPLVGADWVWTFSGDSVTAVDRKSGKPACRWDGYRGTKPTLVGDALAFIESPSRRLVTIACDPAPVVVPPGPCAHLQRCCGAFGEAEKRVGQACASALSRILDLRLFKQCRKALITYAKSSDAPAICRTPPPKAGSKPR